MRRSPALSTRPAPIPRSCDACSDSYETMMKLNRADRAFWSIVAVAAIVGAGAGAVLCCGLWALAHQVRVNGWSSAFVPSLLPAVVLVARSEEHTSELQSP